MVRSANEMKTHSTKTGWFLGTHSNNKKGETSTLLKPVVNSAILDIELETLTSGTQKGENPALTLSSLASTEENPPKTKNLQTSQENLVTVTTVANTETHELRVNPSIWTKMCSERGVSLLKGILFISLGVFVAYQGYVHESNSTIYVSLFVGCGMGVMIIIGSYMQK